MSICKNLDHIYIQSYMHDKNTFDQLKVFIEDTNFEVYRDWQNAPVLYSIISKKLLGSEYEDLLRLALEKGFNVNAVLHVGENLSRKILCFLMRTCHLKSWMKRRILSALILHGARVNDVDSEGCSALYNAVRDLKTDDSLETLEILLSNGAQTNLYTERGDCALRFATMYKLVRATACLLRNGAPTLAISGVYTRSIFDDLILYFVQGTVTLEMLECWAVYVRIPLQFHPGGDGKLLYILYAIRNYNAPLTKFLIENVKDIDACEITTGKNALIELMVTRQDKSGEIFHKEIEDLTLAVLARGADVKRKYDGFTMLWLAVISGLERVVEAILNKYDLNVNARNKLYLNTKSRTSRKMSTTALFYVSTYAHWGKEDVEKKRRIARNLWLHGGTLDIDQIELSDKERKKQLEILQPLLDERDDLIRYFRDGVRIHEINQQRDIMSLIHKLM